MTEKKSEAIVLFILSLPFLLMSISKGSKASMANGEINSKKRKKKQLEDKLKRLSYLIRVRAKKRE